MSRDPDGGLEDLFGASAEPATAAEPARAGAKPRSRAARVTGNVLLVAVATTVTVAVLRSQGIKLPIPLVVAAFTALRLIMLGVSEVAPPPAPRGRRRTSDVGAGQFAGNDTLRTAVRRWEWQLDSAQHDADRFSRIVQPALAELADERLRLRHGVTRSSDPRRARELLGEPLWRMLEEPGRRPPKSRELSAWVDALEKI
ncbi:hypothetical protein [Couchioplanes caeruleus]|uniref:Uncharacterized protein n=2 Tax=Couchioplanes caeruleus TaxID=56438 RepID=A0A1K0GQK5_9ACTN|nr:hypothetical protein [Couchioplanes caeruleus]OJF14686.1 hypothetical protein BG844_08605 [Couchioplanes caeruleus subsp. caeruleus]ROP30087.1 hypothetical protein EDD30_2919 [Couchioplanes caeruleus]